MLITRSLQAVCSLSEVYCSRTLHSQGVKLMNKMHVNGCPRAICSEQVLLVNAFLSTSVAYEQVAH